MPVKNQLLSRIKDLTIGDRTLDAPHCQLIVMATRTARAIMSCTDNARVRPLEHDFATLSARHFSREEDALNVQGRGELTEHARQHRHYLDTLTEGVARFEAGQLSREELCVLVEDKLVHHILVVDAPLHASLSGMTAP